MKKNFLILFIAFFGLKTITIEAHNPPIPAFSALNLCLGDSTHFINQSSGGVHEMWIIQKLDTILHDTLTLDTLYTTDITYYFQNQGTYLVTLYEDNGHIASITKQINIGTTTIADFDFQRCSNQFFNMSTCASSFSWDFGDGTNSTVPFAHHQYADTGTYVVSLIAFNGVTSDTLTKNIHVTETGYPQPVYQIRLSNDTVYCQVTGGNYTAGTLTWYYGDNTTATSTDTFHVFQDTGLYNVRIRVFNTCGQYIYDTVVYVTYLTTSVKELSQQTLQTFIYPNPAKNNIRLRTTDNSHILSIEVYDLIGQLKLKQQNVNPENEIDISVLSTGQYILRIQTERNNYNNRFTKE
ncbi:MAG: T9SS type A sorting domain-containing protein [Bacteroidetes bacterium]|nr:T9SS type A sorting domain-containing protein [Bacteroidota bacterium]